MKNIEIQIAETLNSIDDIQKAEDGWKIAGGTVKMKLFKTLVEKMGCLERPLYFLGNKGNVFNMVWVDEPVLNTKSSQLICKAVG